LSSFPFESIEKLLDSSVIILIGPVLEKHFQIAASKRNAEISADIPDPNTFQVLKKVTLDELLRRAINDGSKDKLLIKFLAKSLFKISPLTGL